MVPIRRNVNKNEVSVKVKHEQEEKSQDCYITDNRKDFKTDSYLKHFDSARCRDKLFPGKIASFTQNFRPRKF